MLSYFKNFGLREMVLGALALGSYQLIAMNTENKVPAGGVAGRVYQLMAEKPKSWTSGSVEMKFTVPVYGVNKMLSYEVQLDIWCATYSQGLVVIDFDQIEKKLKAELKFSAEDSKNSLVVCVETSFSEFDGLLKRKKNQEVVAYARAGRDINNGLEITLADKEKSFFRVAGKLSAIIGSSNEIAKIKESFLKGELYKG